MDANDEASDEWDELSSALSVVEADADHTKILDEYEARGWPLAWLAEHNCYRADTAGLKEVKEALSLPGIFDTVSPGNDKGKWNCYLYRRANGAFFVVRYGKATESPCWSATANGKPCIVFNALPNIRTACLAAGAVEGDGMFTFAQVEQAQAALHSLGLDLPDLEDRSVNVTVKQGRLCVVAERTKKETPPGWATTTRKLSVSYPLPSPSSEGECEFDYVVRAVRNDDDGIDKDGGYLSRPKKASGVP